MTTRQHAYGFCLLVVLVLLVYLPICRHEFLAMDDEVNIYQNPLVTDFTPANLIHVWKTPYAGMYIPLTYNLWSLQAKLSSLVAPPAADGLNPFLFHATNLLVHLANALLVLLILRTLLKSDWAAVAGALLFALHPVQVEPVAWITGFKDVVSGFWSLLAVWQYVLYAQSKGEGRKRHIHYAVATVAFLCALLSKPGAVTLPMIVGATGYLLLHRTLRQLAWELTPWLIITLPVILVTKLSQPDAEIPFLPNVWQRFLVAGDAISFYLYKMAIPYSLGTDYGRSPQYVLRQSWIYLTGLLPYLAVMLLIHARHRTWLLLATIIIAVLLPVLGFLPFSFQEISTVADRYLYLALLAPAYGVGWLLCRYPSKPARILVVATLLLLAIKSSSQTSYWHNYLTLYNHALRVNPQSWISTHNLGVEEHKRRDLEAAITHYAKTLQINPGYAMAYENLDKAVQYVARSRPETIFPSLAQANKGVPSAYGAAYYHLADLCREVKAQKEALLLYEKAVQLAPGLAKAHRAMGDIYQEIGVGEKAKEAYAKAIAADPTLVEAYSSLSSLYLAENSGEEAMGLLAKIITLKPNHAEPYNDLGIVQAQLGRSTEALLSFTKAAETDPSFAPAFNNLSLLYLEQRDFQKAIDAADRAMALGFAVDPAHLQALSAYRGK